MPLGILFWVIFVLWFAFSLWGYYPFAENKPAISFVLLAALLFVLGWAQFGFIIQR